MPTPIDIDKILRETQVPANLDVTGKSFLVHVYEKASRNAIASGFVRNNKLIYVSPGLASINQEGNTLGWMYDANKRLVIDVGNPFLDPFSASFTIRNTDGSITIPSPVAPAVWTIEFELPGGVRYSNSFPNGVAADQVLYPAVLPFTDIKITVRGLGFYGEIEFRKEPASNLAEILAIRELVGFEYPPGIAA